MFRAMILALMGAIFEVRLINMKSGKDIPGTRLFKGGYFKARKAMRKRKLKYGEMIRLQAVAVLDWKIEDNYIKERIEQAKWTPEEVQDLKDKVSEPMVTIPPDMIIVEDNPMADGMPEFVKTRIEGTFPKAEHGIAESNARQSEFMHEHQDEPNEYHGEDLDDHVCDVSGPQDWDAEEGRYAVTCSVCGDFQN